MNFGLELPSKCKIWAQIYFASLFLIVRLNGSSNGTSDLLHRRTDTWQLSKRSNSALFCEKEQVTRNFALLFQAMMLLRSALGIRRTSRAVQMRIGALTLCRIVRCGQLPCVRLFTTHSGFRENWLTYEQAPTESTQQQCAQELKCVQTLQGAGLPDGLFSYAITSFMRAMHTAPSLATF